MNQSQSWAVIKVEIKIKIDQIAGRAAQPETMQLTLFPSSWPGNFLILFIGHWFIFGPSSPMCISFVWIRNVSGCRATTTRPSWAPAPPATPWATRTPSGCSPTTGACEQLARLEITCDRIMLHVHKEEEEEEMWSNDKTLKRVRERLNGQEHGNVMKMILCKYKSKMGDANKIKCLTIVTTTKKNGGDERRWAA